jgi:hypothetical protein
MYRNMRATIRRSPTTYGVRNSISDTLSVCPGLPLLDYPWITLDYRPGLPVLDYLSWITCPGLPSWITRPGLPWITLWITLFGKGLPQMHLGSDVRWIATDYLSKTSFRFCQPSALI